MQIGLGNLIDNDEHVSDGDIQDPQDHPNVHTDKDGPLFGRFRGNVRRGNLCRAGARQGLLALFDPWRRFC